MAACGAGAGACMNMEMSWSAVSFGFPADVCGVCG
jgi:hypothetical protein